MKKIFALLLVVVLFTTSSPLLALAKTDYKIETIEPQSIIQCTRSFVAATKIRGDVSVNARSSAQSSVITSKITLQSAPLGTTSFTDVANVNPEEHSVEDTVMITHKCSFPITSNKEYRIKIEITDNISVPVTRTYYQELER